MRKQDLVNEVTDLRKVLAWMDMVMANLNDGVFVIDKFWKVTFINSQLAELVGTMRVLLLSKDVWKAVPLSYGGESLETKISKEKIRVDKVAALNGIYELSSFKTSRIMELRCTYMPSLEQAVGVLTDITLETRAMDQLHKKQAVNRRSGV